MSIPPIMFIPPPRHRRKRREFVASAPEPAGLTVLEARHTSPDTQVVVLFSGPIAWNGVDVPQGFKAYTSDGFLDPPIYVVAVDGAELTLEFNAGVLVGAEWVVDGVMEGITPGVVVPQGGFVIE